MIRYILLGLTILIIILSAIIFFAYLIGSEKIKNTKYIYLGRLKDDDIFIRKWCPLDDFNLATLPIAYRELRKGSKFK